MPFFFCKTIGSNNFFYSNWKQFQVFKIGKFEFKVTVHYSLWAKCTQLWPLKYWLLIYSDCKPGTCTSQPVCSFVVNRHIMVRKAEVLRGVSNYILMLSKLLFCRSASDFRVLHGHSGPIYGVSFSPDRSFVLSSSEDGTGWLVLFVIPIGILYSNATHPCKNIYKLEWFWTCNFIHIVCTKFWSKLFRQVT